MKSKLIILRGNSGSGKTTTANLLGKKLGDTTMLISQDVVRREILKVKDEPLNPAIKLIYDMALYGNDIGYTVILEGIFSKKKYGSMLDDLISKFKGEVHVFYFDVTFEETLRRHLGKPNAHEFGEEEMRDWWKEKDYLIVENEKFITDDMKQSEIVKFILKDVIKQMS